MDFSGRRKKVYGWLVSENLDAIVIEDSENRRSKSLRYLCGMPADSLLILTASGESILVPWDIHLAEQFSQVDRLLPYNEFERRYEKAVQQIAKKYLPPNPRIEVGSATPVPLYSELKKALDGEIVCRDGGMDTFLDDLRAVKDHEEIGILREAAGITDRMLDRLYEIVQEERNLSEIDIAMFIESETRQLGAEGMGFPLIAAGPERSFAIHAFPNYSASPFGAEGMSILDFGVLFEGYTTDVTCTVCRGPLSKKQENMIRSVEEAYDMAAGLLKPDASTREIAAEIEAFFAEGGYEMPHSLGHGIGLAAHETPFLRNRKNSETELKSGMVVTIEPGLYSPESGGVRLENDFLITPEGAAEALTSSRIYTLP